MNPRLSADPDASMMRGEFRELARPLAVLGLDPGKTTGFCLYSPNARPVFGIYMMTGEDLGAHLAGFKHWLEDMIADHRPAVLALERPFGRAAFTNDLPGTLCGVAHMVAHLNSVPRSEFTASAVKKAMSGNGKAGKGAVIAAIRERFGVAALSSHEADAAAVAIMGWSKEAQDRMNKAWAPK
jgi:crossover junction endodeoxyribonuclease RuvC